MARFVNPSWKLFSAALAVSLLLAGCGGKKKQQPDLSATAEPDKVLYDRAMEDLRKNRHIIARLTLQTLINAYPDSEYLAKSKLAIADSYYKEGGTSNLTQAVAEYKDFMTFFPFLDEAAYAQMQVGMCYYRRMEKPDRDRTQARLAEVEFQTFLLKFPEHELSAEAEQRLREVQEVLAEGEFRTARFYYIKGSLRAATSRLRELADRYPLYTQADRAIWMLANTYERAEQSQAAALYYSRIVRDYPLSELVEDAKEKLVKLGVPIPQPDPDALKRMEQERQLQREKPGLLRRSLGILRSGPDVSIAARTGKPNLSPPSETAAGETLTPGGTLAVGPGGTGSTVAVETVQPGAAASSLPPAATAAAPGAGNPPAASADAAKSPLKETKEEEKKRKKEEEEKKKKEKESSSKKKKGLRKIIPW